MISTRNIPAARNGGSPITRRSQSKSADSAITSPGEKSFCPMTWAWLLDRLASLSGTTGDEAPLSPEEIAFDGGLTAAIRCRREQIASAATLLRNGRTEAAEALAQEAVEAARDGGFVAEEVCARLLLVRLTLVRDEATPPRPDDALDATDEDENYRLDTFPALAFMDLLELSKCSTHPLFCAFVSCAFADYLADNWMQQEDPLRAEKAVRCTYDLYCYAVCIAFSHGLYAAATGILQQLVASRLGSTNPCQQSGALRDMRRLLRQMRNLHAPKGVITANRAALKRTRQRIARQHFANANRLSRSNRTRPGSGPTHLQGRSREPKY